MSTVGRDEAVIRDSVRKEEDQRLDQLNLCNEAATAKWLKTCGAALAPPALLVPRRSASFMLYEGGIQRVNSLGVVSPLLSLIRLRQRNC